MKYLKILTETFLLIFIFLLPWQTKLILVPATNNYLELSFYLSYLPLLLSLICFIVYRLLLKKDESETRKKIPKYWFFLFAFIFFNIISLFFASDKLLASYKIGVLLLALALFYILKLALNQESLLQGFISRSRAIYVFLASIFLQAILGIYQFLSQSTFASKYLGLAFHDPALAGTSVIETSSGRWLRAYGGLDHPNILAGVLVVALLLAAYLLAKRKIINSRLHIYGLLSIFIAYFIYLSALFFSFSRSAWLAFLVGAVALGLFFFKKEDKWTKGRYFVLLFFSLMLVATLSFSYRDLLSTRIQASSRLEQISLNERSEQLQSARSLIKKEAWLGLGTGNYIVALKNTLPEKEAAYAQPVHNSYILLLLENGIFALLSFLLFIFFLGKDNKRGPLFLALILALGVLMIFEHWFFSLPFGTLFLLFVLGLI